MLESGGMVSFWTLCSCKRSLRCRGCYKCMNLRKHQRLQLGPVDRNSTRSTEPQNYRQ
jgi:hypothetical protein